MSNEYDTGNGVDHSEEELRLTPDEEPHLTDAEMRASPDDKLDALLLDTRRTTYRVTVLAQHIAGVEKAARDRAHELRGTLTCLSSQLELVIKRQDAQEELHVKRHKLLLDRLDDLTSVADTLPPPKPILPTGLITLRSVLLVSLGALGSTLVHYCTG